MHAMTDLDIKNTVVWPKWCYPNNLMDSEAAQDLVLNNNNHTITNNNCGPISLKEKDHPQGTEAPRRKKPRRDPHPPRPIVNGQHSLTYPGVTVGPIPNGMPNDAGGNTHHQGDVKAERLSPVSSTQLTSSGPLPQQQQPQENHPQIPQHLTVSHASPAPSTSPKSPASHRTRTPSFPGTPPNPAFTPPTQAIHSPYDRFSPAALGAMGGMPGSIPGGHGAIKQMESLMTRNCSDLMRSLAAKYNNSNPNDFFSSPNNGFIRANIPGGIPGGIPNSMAGGIPCGIPQFKPGQPPFLPVSTPSSIAASIRESERKIEPSVSVSSSINLPPGLQHHPGAPIFPGTGLPGFPGFPLVDMSSTQQVLLNMVRNASAAQQTQLENYLKGAMKRPAENPSSPLDLSSSVGAKRPRTDLGRPFDVKHLFNAVNNHHQEEDRKENVKVSPSLSPPSVKPRLSLSPVGNPVGTPKPPPANVGIPCNDRNCPTLEGILHWTVDDVCSFVGSIDLCAEYVEAFREQRIDGSALPLLTEDHLTASIQMKLGPALKLRSVLARKLGSCNICLHCTHCHTNPAERRTPQIAAMQ